MTVHDSSIIADCAPKLFYNGTLSLSSSDTSYSRSHGVALFYLRRYFFVYLLVSLTCTLLSYLKVFRIISRHQQQVQANESSQNFGQPTIDLAKYKESVITIMFILGIFYISYLPFLVITGRFILNNYTGLEMAFMISLLCLFLSSSLNPVIYIWRMNDIRNGEKNVLNKFSCIQYK